MIVDTHCHLNDVEKFPDVGAEIALGRSYGVERMIVVGVKPEEWEFTVKLAERHAELFCILGWHPNYTVHYRKSVLEELEELAGSSKCLAIGEIGLDYHWNYSPREAQRRALQDQLDLAQKLRLPVVFHAREAYSDLLDLLEARDVPRCLFHCFAGNSAEAERAVRLDAYFGVDGPITYKNAENLRCVIQGLPRNRVVLETDAPYLAPVPFRGKPNRPAYVHLINRQLAAIWELEEAACADLTTDNAGSFFGEKLMGKSV
jgi:TatD DNase family protein